MKILIADDELVSRKKMERLLNSLGHETLAQLRPGQHVVQPVSMV